MSKTSKKKTPALPTPSNTATLSYLQDNNNTEIGSYLTTRELGSLACTSTYYNTLFKPIISAREQLTAVVEGNPHKLARLVQKNPFSLFIKDTVIRSKKYTLDLLSEGTNIQPNVLYLQIHNDGSLGYTVHAGIDEDPITDTIEPLTLRHIDADIKSALPLSQLTYPLALEQLQRISERQLTAILEITSERNHTLTLEQKFINISAYQLMIFLSDSDMLQCIMPLIQELELPQRLELARIRQRQYQELGVVGSDLIKTAQDPLSMDTDALTQLLGNPDGIIYYQDPATKSSNLYYINSKDNKPLLLDPQTNTINENIELASLCCSFDKMTDNSSRRSTDEEHKIIAQILRIDLVRTGIKHELDGDRYCSNRMEFRLINHYKHCISTNTAQKNWFERVDACHQASRAQLEVMWLLQRLCEVELYPDTDTETDEITDFNLRTTPLHRRFTSESACDASDRINQGLGLHYLMSDFKVFRTDPRNMLMAGLPQQLIQIEQQIEQAKAQVIAINKHLQFEEEQMIANNAISRGMS